MQRIGILYNPLSDRSVRMSGEIASWLLKLGLSIWRGTSEEGREDPGVVEDMELMLALGGDGTVLRAARLAIPFNIPILTVAMGRLNFMAELSPNELPDAIKTLQSGGGWYEQRSLLDISLLHAGQQRAKLTALNEVVLSRGDIGRTLNVDVLIDDIPLTTYRADGVLVATATGSTAYALSAGGPIVDPRSRSLVLVPVAAHLTAVPAMVLHEDTIVTLIAHCYDHATLSVDGHEDMAVHEGDLVHVCRSSKVCTFARVQPPTQLYASFVKRLRRE
jgi:NAD+ kinase